MKSNRIWKELKRRANGDSRALAMWRAYVDFLQSRPTLPDNTPDTAVHHILWRSEYPKYVKSEWNLIRLTHEDHTAAAALALAAEPDNGSLRTGFAATYRMAGTSKTWKPANPKKVIHLYEQGHPAREVGETYGISAGTVLSFLQRSGVRIRNNSEAKSWMPKNPQSVIHLYEQGYSQQDIGKKFGKGHGAITHFLQKRGVQIRRRDECMIWKPTNPELVIADYLGGQSARQIAKQFSIHARRVLGFLRRNKISIRSRDESNRISKQNRAQQLPQAA